MSCYECLQRRQEIEERIRRARAEKDCLEIAKQIYEWLAAHPNNTLTHKTITITVPSVSTKRNKVKET